MMEKTKRQVRLLILVPVALTLIAVASLSWLQMEITRTSQMDQNVRKVERNVLDLDRVISDFLLYPEERPKVQFRSVYDQLAKNLSLIQPRSIQEQELVRQMRLEQEEIRSLFPLLTGDAGETGAGRGNPATSELKERVIGQLLVNAEEIVGDSFQLARLNQEKRDSLVRWVIISVITLILTLGAAIVILTSFIGKKIIQTQDDLEKEISERRRAEEALRNSREDLARAQEVGQIGWWRLDTRHNVLTWSNENYRIFGLPSGTPLSYETFLEVVHPDDRRQVDAQWTASLRGAPYDIEHRIVADGQEKWVREKAYLEFDEAGELLGGFGITQDITERKQMEEDLRTSEERLRISLGEKEALLKEIHHRVKNNLQVISSLVALQADGLQDGAMRAAFQDVTHRVRAMAMVHEKLYQSADLARVEFAEYARSLLAYLWRSHGTTTAGIELVLDLESVALPVHLAVPCGLILNELITNALKHAFQGRGGEVSVSLRHKAPGPVVLRVRDNGAGLPVGFDWRQAPSLGLRLVEMLAGQLHAAVEVSGSGGTEFVLSFAVQEQEKRP